MDGNHRVFELQDDSTNSTYADDQWIKSVPSDNKLTPGLYASGIKRFLYTDDYGTLWAAGVNALSPTVRFARNQVLTGYYLLSDSQGKLWYINDYDNPQLKPASYDGTQLTIQPNKLVSSVFSDNDGNAWAFNGSGIEKLPIKATPNQYGSRPEERIPSVYHGGSSYYAYSDDKGVLHTIRGGHEDSTTIVTGLPAGMIFPESRIVIWDGTGQPWDCAYSCRKIASKKLPFPAGTWAYSGYSGSIYASDSEGKIWNSTGWDWKLVPDAKTDPNLVTSFSNDIKYVYMNSKNGLWQINVGNNLAVPKLSAATAGEASGNNCVAQMPTTGAPEGLSLIGLVAVGIGLSGLAFAVTRRSRR